MDVIELEENKSSFKSFFIFVLMFFSRFVKVFFFRRLSDVLDKKNISEKVLDLLIKTVN